MCVSVVDVLVRDRRAVEIKVFVGVEAFGVVVINRRAGDGQGQPNQSQRGHEQGDERQWRYRPGRGIRRGSRCAGH